MPEIDGHERCDRYARSRRVGSDGPVDAAAPIRNAIGQVSLIA